MKEGVEKLARAEWLAACSFDPSDDVDVLSRLKDRIKETVATGRTCYVLLDLDSTLYEVAPRTAHILKEAARSLEAVPPNVTEALNRLEEPGYSIDDTWRKLGLCDHDEGLRALRDRLHAYWEARFFTNEYLLLDRPYAGTKEFACELHSLGAELVYLTGRDEPGMKWGTLHVLKRDGFPTGPRTQLRMKADPDGDDVEHKIGVALELSSQGKVVASLENEPRCFVALYQAIPDAFHVFVDTVCSDTPAEAVHGAYRIRRFVGIAAPAA